LITGCLIFKISRNSVDFHFKMYFILPTKQLLNPNSHQKMESAISKLCKTVFERIDAAVAASTKTKTCRLVGASKTKSVDVMMEAYNAGVRHFGENYTDEIVKKAPLVRRVIDEILI